MRFFFSLTAGTYSPSNLSKNLKNRCANISYWNTPNLGAKIFVFNTLADTGQIVPFFYCIFLSCFSARVKAFCILSFRKSTKKLPNFGYFGNMIWEDVPFVYQMRSILIDKWLSVYHKYIFFFLFLSGTFLKWTFTLSH